MTPWRNEESELEWFRRMRDAYAELVSYGDANDRLRQSWLSEHRERFLLLTEIRKIKNVALSVGTLDGTIPVRHLEGLFDLLEEYEKELREPF